VGGLIALLTAPITISQCWQDRPRLVIETEYADYQPIYGATVQYAAAPSPFYEAPNVQAIPSNLPKADRKLIVTLRNLGRRPIHIEVIALAWLDEPGPRIAGRARAIGGPLIQSARFDHILTEDNRKALFVIDVPAKRSLMAVAVTDDTGDEHILRVLSWPAGVPKNLTSPHFKHL